MKKVLLIGMGGTIASNLSGDGLYPELGAVELLSYVPEISSFCEVDAINICKLDSTNLTPAHWLLLASEIEKNYSVYDGFVISHGTDTMAYTAAALSYLVQVNKPVILTGAQKPINFDYTDSKINLKDSFIAASSDALRGVHIVFNGKVILGTRARKTHSKSFYAFSSINYPIVASIQDSYLLRYIKCEPFEEEKFYSKLDPDVGLLKLMPGTKSDLLRYIFEKNKVVVIESFGVGGLPEYEGADFKEIALEYLSEGKMLIVTSQVENEGSDLGVYHVGKGLSMCEGVFEAYDMTLESVLTKAMWLLADTSSVEEFGRRFYMPISMDILFESKYFAER